MGGMTLDSASSTGTEEQDIKDMEKKPNVKTEEGRVISPHFSYVLYMELLCFIFFILYALLVALGKMQ